MTLSDIKSTLAQQTRKSYFRPRQKVAKMSYCSRPTTKICPEHGSSFCFKYAMREDERGGYCMMSHKFYPENEFKADKAWCYKCKNSVDLKDFYTWDGCCIKCSNVTLMCNKCMHWPCECKKHYDPTPETYLPKLRNIPDNRKEQDENSRD